ncbi:glycoside hydrolase superfamily [Aspergillus terricola var. indicus]
MLSRLLLVVGLVAVLPVHAQDCSALNPCATGCCSKSGYCGVGDEYCGVDYCSPESCVSGCENKAYCDPGGYGDYAEHSKCPLNVCCSKYGYCGITEEFCGNKKVKRPSAEFNGYTPLNKIVGYYEGWSRNRKCHTFFPEQITLGIYTHLNYAFATIDPETFEVKLASSTEADLDPDLKVFIAIGGWAYNDPGPTRTTFSDLAASHDAQKRFFKSLISFLSTYNLDGVDIDWEYPGPDDIVERGGREEDFKNFPVFLQRLKQALKSAGGRDGLTITLPASYWFLQYFDIVKLEKYVDFFNMMTYDLHGAWDRGNKWVGPYLNAHTNLTEIQDAMDLIWRNKIPSKKVILGTGFYGRAITATSESCMEPGCTYESAANKGPCSNENGILLNSEIVDIINEKGLKPKLYKEAGVKVVHWDNQWVAYDDEETLELKAQFALGQALGGVMVWARYPSQLHRILERSHQRVLPKSLVSRT